MLCFDHRRGTASLEFVLSLPMLMGLGAIIITLGMASVHKTSVTSGVRNSVWKDRSTTKTSKVLSVFAGPTDGVIQSDASSTIPVYPWLGGTQTAKSSAAVLGGVWDHSEITTFTNKPKGPHIGTFLQVFGVPEGMANLINNMLGLLTFTSLPNQDAIDDAGEQADAAEEEAKKKKKEVQEKLAQMKAELAELQQELADLKQQEQAKKDEIKAKEEALQKLKDDGASAAEIAAAEAELAAAKDDLKKIQNDIKIKEQQIEQKKKDIEKWEDAMADAADEEDKLP